MFKMTSESSGSCNWKALDMWNYFTKLADMKKAACITYLSQKKFSTYVGETQSISEGLKLH